MNYNQEFEFDFSLCHGYNNFDDDDVPVNYGKCLYSC